MLDRLKSWLGFGSLTDEQFERQRRELLQKTPVPVFWLFGKTGSGKSTIVRYLTGATQAEIGNGFRPQTTTSSQYDFPTSDQPIVRFLDTRGLGESGYDPSEDLKLFDASTHVLVVVVRVMDHALQEVVEALRKIRAARPTRPVVLALTCLHEAYPFEQHPDPDPFEQVPGTGNETSATNSAGRPAPSATPSTAASIPELRRCLAEQEQRFAGLVDRIVPIDLTLPEDGFAQPEFGGKRLEEALIDVLPAACRQVLLHLDDARHSLRDLTAKQAMQTIITYSSLAATAAATPLPLVDIPAVMGIQTRLIYVLADLYDQKMNADMLMKMVGAAAGQLALRFAVRAPLKFIPFVGLTANAAMAFAYTFSLGKACCWYFGEIRSGHVPQPEELNKVWGEQLEQAVAVWRNRRGST